MHRKGATRAFPAGSDEIPEVYRDVGQPVFIPGSMGTSSFVLAEPARSARLQEHLPRRRPPALPDGRPKAGLGAELRRELEARGIVVRSPSNKGLAEEAPLAYRTSSRAWSRSSSAPASRGGSLPAQPIGVVGLSATSLPSSSATSVPSGHSLAEATPDPVRVVTLGAVWQKSSLSGTAEPHRLARVEREEEEQSEVVAQPRIDGVVVEEVAEVVEDARLGAVEDVRRVAGDERRARRAHGGGRAAERAAAGQSHVRAPVRRDKHRVGVEPVDRRSDPVQPVGDSR